MKDYKKILLGSVATSALLLETLAATSPVLASSAEVGRAIGKFYIKSMDGKFSIITNTTFKFMYTIQDNDDQTTGDGSSTDTSFNNSISFTATGRAGHHQLTYKVGLSIPTASSGPDENQAIQSTAAYLQWKFSNAFNFKAGAWRQRFTESSYSTFVSNPRGTGDLFSMGRDVGIGLIGKDKSIGYELSLINGNTLKSPDANKNQSIHAHIRIEPFGSFGGFYSGDESYSRKLKFIATAAGYYKDNVTFSTRSNQNTFISRAGNADISGWTVGAAAKWRGLSLAGEYATHRLRDADTRSPTDPGHVGEKGQSWNMEVSSFLIPKKCSISARYERSMTNMMASSTTTASTTSNGNDGERRYGLATAYYFRGHSSKITADWVQIVDNDGGLDTNQVSTRTEDNRFRIQWLVKF